MKRKEVEEEEIPNAKTSLLSNKGILRNKENGKIIIEPFKMENLTTSSYDVTLGENFYREQLNDSGLNIYNPYSEEDVARIWGKPQKPENAGEWMKKTGVKLMNVSDENQIIWISPNETILAHTQEYIGGRESITTMMKARSSMGRNFIEVCKCAGMGDVGFTNRWTMEITNNSQKFTIPLIVGRRVAQIVFFDTEGILSNSYEKTGKYQKFTDLEKLKESWSPSDMLPKLYKDRDLPK